LTKRTSWIGFQQYQTLRAGEKTGAEASVWVKQALFVGGRSFFGAGFLASLSLTGLLAAGFFAGLSSSLAVFLAVGVIAIVLLCERRLGAKKPGRLGPGGMGVK
jgi:hypothetical protein